MKPVELDFLIKNGTQATFEKIARDALAVGDASEKGADAASMAMQRAAFQALILKDNIESVETQLVELRNANIDLDQGDNIGQVTQLENTLERLKVQLKEVEEQANQTDPTPKKLPDAKRQFNGLHMSIQQLAREMPTLALGPEVFMLAISNNLPIFTDEVARARQEYADLLAQGGKGTPVWQQMLKSVFSPQTALTAIILLFVMYGKEIFNAVGEVLRFNDASADTQENLAQIHEEMKNTSKSAADISVNITSLSKKWRELGGDIEAQKKFLEDNREELDKTGLAINSVEDAEQALVDKLPQYLKYLQVKARADAAYALAVKDNTEKLVKMQELQNNIAKIDSAEMQAKDEGKRYLTHYNIGGEIQDIREFWRKEIVKLEEQSPFQALFEQYSAEAADLLSGAGLKTLEEGKEEEDASSKAQAEAEKLKKQREDALKSVKGVIDPLYLENEQSRIDLMSEGLEKRLAQIQLNYDKEIAEIERGEQRVREAQNGSLTPEQSRVLNESRILATSRAISDGGDAFFEDGEKRRKERDENEAALNSMLEDYATFEQQRLKISEKYALRRAAMFSDAAQTQFKDGYGQGNLDNLNASEEIELKGVDDAERDKLLEDSSLLIRLFTNAEQQSSKSIKKIIADTQMLLDYINNVSGAEIPVGVTSAQVETIRGNADQIADIMAALYGKQEELDSRRIEYPFSDFIDGYKSLAKSAELYEAARTETNKKEKESLELRAAAAKEKGMDQIAEGANYAADSVAFLSSKLQELADATGDERLSESAEQLGAAAQNFQAAAQGFAQGGWIGAIIGGVTDMISQTFEASVIAEAEQKEFEQNRLDFLSQYNLKLKEINDEDYSSIFGEKTFDKAKEASKAAQDALDEYYEHLAKTTIPDIEKEFSNLGTAVFSGLGIGLSKRVSAESKTLLAAYEKGYTDLQAMAVKTKDRSGWSNFWGAQDQYMSLKDLAPELWGDDGAFDIEAAKVFLETNTQINEEQRKEIQNVIDLNDAYEANLQILKDIAAEDFGFLGDAAKESLVEALTSGADSWDLFKEKGAAAFEELGEKLMYELFLASKFENLQDDLISAYGIADPEEAARRQAELLDSFFSGIEGDMKAAEAFGQEWQKWITDKGYNIWSNSTTQSGEAGAFTTMSQDQGTKLEGLFTENEIHVDNIDTNVELVVDQLTLASKAIDRIRDNTEYCRRLEQIADDIGEMKRDGIKMI